MSTEIGKVLGTEDAQPLDFWIVIEPEQIIQLDDVVFVTRVLSDGTSISLFGIVDILKARHEGARFDSDVFLSERGLFPLGRTTIAHVTVTRVEPEIFVPPLPGEAVYGNLEFLDGSRGAHINISGISGVATKTTYATFLLYGLFHSDVFAEEVTNTKAIVFNVKGEDLLFLDQPNARRKVETDVAYAKLGVTPGAFASVSIYAPVKAHEQVMIPDTGSRREGVTAFCWTIEEFCRERYLRFLFAEADDETSHLSAVVDRVEAALARETDFSRFAEFDHLVEFICQNAQGWAQASAGGHNA